MSRSSETLPAIRSTSPSSLPLLKGGSNSNSKPLHESIALPPIQSLTRDFPSRLAQRDSPPEQGYQRKRAGISGDATPPGTNKRRRVDSNSDETNSSPYNGHGGLERNGSSGSFIPESNVRRQILPSTTEPSTPTQASLRTTHRAGTHSRNSSIGTGTNKDMLPLPTGVALAPPASAASHEHITKQEQITPPSVVVQSPATPSTANTASGNTSATGLGTGWNKPSASFSRRISNASSSSSSHRPTPRKQPPSRLNFQISNTSGHSSHGSLGDGINNIAPSIRSAPPVPVPGGLAAQSHQPPPIASSSTWLTNRSGAGGAGGTPRPRHVSQLSSDVALASTPRARDNRDVWTSIPTPTSLRLGARSIVQPAGASAANQPAGANSPSTRLPITPAVPSPIPQLGGGSGLQDKAKFMGKMSEIYDRATSGHKSCISSEEVDRRIRDALMLRDHEILQLKAQVAELQKLLRQPLQPITPGLRTNNVASSHHRHHSSHHGGGGHRPVVDEDGDVNMSMAGTAGSVPGTNGGQMKTSVPAASNGDRSTIPRTSPPKSIDANKKDTNSSEEVARPRLPTPPVNGIASHSSSPAPASAG